MTPLKLTLRGFIGVRDGMGRDELTLDLESVKGALVAITGPNGTGKTTVLDNLHPYRIMPSRASSYSANAFSYWAQVHGGEAMKELVWSHAGIEYKSILIFRTTGKTQKAEAYLQVWAEDSWQPYSAGSIVSDGKATTYDACIESILGTPELYFTAAFSAQGRKLLSGYTNGEIKSLLSSLLGLDHIGELAVEANEKRLTAERNLQAIRDSGAEYQGLPLRLEAVTSVIAQATITQDQQTQASQAVRAGIQTLTEALAERKAEQAQAADSEKRAAGLRRQLDALNAQEATELKEADDAERSCAANLEFAYSTHRDNLSRHRRQIERHQRELTQQEGLLARREEVETAVKALADHEKQLAELDTKIEACEVTGAKYKDAPAKAATLAQTVKGLEREMVSLTDKHRDLERRSKLIDTVPCAGMELQSTCDLLKEARAAKDQIPQVLDQHRLKVDEHQAASEAADDAKAEAEEHARLSQEWRDLSNTRNSLLKTMDAVKAVTAMKASVDQADTMTAQIRASITELESAITTAEQEWKISEDRMVEAAKAAQRKLHDVPVRFNAQREPIQNDLNSLPRVSAVGTAVADAEKALADAKASLDDVEKALDSTKADLAKLQAEKAQLDAMAEKAASHEADVATAADDLAHWNTLSKALGPNGVVALVIDDAGPSLAALTNDLLRACYGPRFSVRIDTQHANTDGTYREDFDIVVFDSQSGESKSLVNMSGGERIWNNDALCSAVAIFHSQRSGRNYECRMSDESDGALDAEKKQQYMEMKRQVLKLAGLDREFFISHSTATWELADAVIDLGQYVINQTPVAKAA